MATILTLCEQCREIYADGFRMKPITGRTTTEKQKKCEHCGRSFSSPYDLKQYLVNRKGGKS